MLRGMCYMDIRYATADTVGRGTTMANRPEQIMWGRG